VIAVVGNPIGSIAGGGIVAAGLPAAVARAAVAAGGAVQLIGKLGEGSNGDAILLSLAADGVGHAALLRDPGSGDVGPIPAAADLGDGPLDELAGLDGTNGSHTGGAATPPGPTLEAADLELALRYLPDYDVVVVAQPLDPAALGAVAGAARWSGSQLIVLGGADVAIPDDATVLEPPSEDAEGAFATLVGRYAAALDAGVPAERAFADASAAAGWAAAAD
jgi:hypothetical protein